MILKKITNLLGIAAIGLMMGSSVSYAVKGYGLLDASGDWARLIASNIASSSSSFSSNKVDCSKYDLTKVTCEAKEAWVLNSVDLYTDGQGDASTTLSRFIIKIKGALSYTKYKVVVSVPDCQSNPVNVCNKSFVMNNEPKVISTTKYD